jgi:microcompartment protein CcmK/EutM
MGEKMLMAGTCSYQLPLPPLATVHWIGAAEAATHAAKVKVSALYFKGSSLEWVLIKDGDAARKTASARGEFVQAAAARMIGGQ